MRRPDGMTRALCYDADTPQDWEHLLDAARSLSEAGYLPLVEDSPALRGGYLWIIYTRLVYAPAAHQHARQVAPMLRHIPESWPGPGPNKVRLPGGKYIKPGFTAWCKLHDAHGGRIAEDGQSAARVMLAYQTPAELVPASPSADSVEQTRELAALLNEVALRLSSVPPVAQRQSYEPEPCRTGVESLSEPAPLPNAEEECSMQSLRIAPCTGLDQQWYEKYNRHLWFQFTPAQLAAW